jgi:mutual gliding-motility protein MglA
VAQVNPLTRELLIKLVYYGPGLGGKTTSLQRIHSSSPPETRGQIVSLATPVDRTLYFDFLPLRTDSIRGHHVRLQLFTVPGQVYFNATRKLVLTGADGVCFVADSQRARMDANLESFENLAENLEAQGRNLSDIPLVFQFNKRDLPGVMSMEEMDAELNALGVPVFPSSAATGEGVVEALDALVQAVIEDFERKKILGTQGRSARAPEFSRAHEGLEDELGRVSQELTAPSPRIEEDDADDERATLPPRPGGAPPPLPLRPVVGHRTVPPPAPTFSLSSLFPRGGAEAREIEAHLAAGRVKEALVGSEAFVTRPLGDLAERAGAPEELRSPVFAATLLGVEPHALPRLRARVAHEGELDAREGLEAYALLIEVAIKAERFTARLR